LLAARGRASRSAASRSAGTRHKIANAAGETARLALFFDRPSHKVNFDEPLMPMDDNRSR
jgi:hypothetical protein